MIYLITYDLKTSGSYQKFYDTIKSYGTWWHYLDKTWLIKTADSPSTIYKKLSPLIEEGDHLFIVEVNLNIGHYYGILNRGAWDWIKKNR